MGATGDSSFVGSGPSNGSHTEEKLVTEVHKDEARLQELRELLGKADGDPLRVVGVGAGAWGSVFLAMLQDTYGTFRDSIQVSTIIFHY
jgi:glycerol-3-phosphate dehydrogenase (NAD+)